MSTPPFKSLFVFSVLLVAAIGCGDPDYSGSGSSNANNDPGNNDVNNDLNNDVNNDQNNDVNNDQNNDVNNVEARIPLRHRATADACDDARSESNAGLNYPEDEMLACRLDSDCVDGPNGRCVDSRFGPDCTYDGCFQDDECGGQVCLCGESSLGVNRCLSRGDCLVDADCGPGGYCSPSFGDCGSYSGVVAFYCHTPQDECIDDSDCEGQFDFGGYCAFNPSVGRWMCSNAECDG